jgi:hypothetical protein
LFVEVESCVGVAYGIVVVSLSTDCMSALLLVISLRSIYSCRRCQPNYWQVMDRMDLSFSWPSVHGSLQHLCQAFTVRCSQVDVHALSGKKERQTFLSVFRREVRAESSGLFVF